MKYTANDVSALIEEVEGQDDVIGHCSRWFPNNSSVCREDGLWPALPNGEDR